MDTDPRNAQAQEMVAVQDVRDGYDELSVLQVAQAIGSFADDPPDTPYQRAYLAELWTILREKMP